MRAAVYEGGGRITIATRADPAAGPGEIVLRMRACGMCGSDLMQWYQDPRAPVVLGHEPVGEVVDTGSGVAFAVGDRVFAHHHVPCFECPLCRRGRQTLCERFRATAIDPGGFAEYIRVPAPNVAHDVLLLPPELDDVAATLVEPVACIVRGQRLAGVAPGALVAVVGAGSMGLLQIQVAHALGAGVVVAVEPDVARAEIARRLGAIVADGLDAAAVRAALAGDLADQVFVCTHAPSAIAESIHMAAPAGVVQLFAVPEPGHSVRLDLGAVFFREVAIQSTYSAGPDDTREALALLAAKRIDPAGIITHRVPLAETQRGYDLARSGRAIKVTITAD